LPNLARGEEAWLIERFPEYTSYLGAHTAPQRGHQEH
jgi:hypothetical protein